jgi:hypothetical protein
VQERKTLPILQNIEGGSRSPFARKRMAKKMVENSQKRRQKASRTPIIIDTHNFTNDRSS